MNIIDSHTHLGFVKPEKSIKEHIDNMEISGACVFSPPPIEYDSELGMDFDARLDRVISFTSEYKDILFPIIWIHPYEEDIFKKIDICAEKDIAGFKIICSDFYVSEEQVIEVLKHISKTGKPVFFHSGILWNGQNSSKYNRPANWEALINIKGLRFSMGHCSWPWADECIAVYGKFLNAASKGDKAEMFLDITPGTPEIYRRDLFTKLFTIGYDIENNIFFGTDCNADSYNSSWLKKLLETDKKLLDELGVSKKVRENLYYNNTMRFLGKHVSKGKLHIPVTDNSNAWSPLCADVPGIIEGYYKKIGFGKEFDKEFYKALESIKISDAISIDDYNLSENDGKRNLLSFLFLCKNTEELYSQRGISREILYDTLSDLAIWTKIWSRKKGRLYLGELEWLSRHLKAKLFKLGRLQFCLGNAEFDIPDENISKGDKVIEVHLPSNGEPLTYDACIKSFSKAREFFAAYFPDFDYKCFTCHSWLLDSSLKEILKSDSNILKFQSMFKLIKEDESNAVLNYVFEWGINPEDIKNVRCTSTFAENVKKRVLSGKSFYEGFGIVQ